MERKRYIWYTEQIINLSNTSAATESFTEEWFLEAQGETNVKSFVEALSHAHLGLHHEMPYQESNLKHEKPRLPLHFQSDNTYRKLKSSD